jgi:hypothetical protein
MLVDLTQWLARIMQYSSRHPACAQLGTKALGGLHRVLDESSPATFGILKDGVLLDDDVSAWQPAIRQRLAPHLYERGVMRLRFLTGVSLDELTAFMDVLTMPVQAIFDGGGISRIVSERGVSRIQVDELEHEITTEEREHQTRRRELGEFFAWTLEHLRAERALGIDIGTQLFKLLEHPQIAIAVLEENPLDVCDALAALCLMVQKEATREGEEKSAVLLTKLHAIMVALSPASHDRVLLGFPSLVGDFRDALGWALRAMSADDLARIVMASMRRRAHELDLVFYALGVAVPHDGDRTSAMRRVALNFYDLPTDDAVADDLLAQASRPVEEFDTYWRERQCLAPHATAVLARRLVLPRRGQSMPPPGDVASRELDTRRVIAEIIKMSSRTRRFDRLCTRLPLATATLSASDANEAVVGVLHGLASVQREEWRELAGKTLKELTNVSLAERLLSDIDHAASADTPIRGDAVQTVRILVAVQPEAALEHLGNTESRKMRRILLDALGQAGPGMLPYVRAKLQSSSWFVVRNAVSLLPRVGGGVRDLARVANHPNEKVRLEIARSLRAMPLDGAVAELAAGYLGDASSEVRIQARGLVRGDVLAPSGIVVVERIANDESQPEDVRRYAIDALAQSPNDAAAKALFQLIQPRGLIDLGTLRDHAAVALRKSRAPGAAALFQEGLKSSAWRVRKSCERAASGEGG